jgi:hypothetical protein
MNSFGRVLEEEDEERDYETKRTNEWLGRQRQHEEEQI